MLIPLVELRIPEIMITNRIFILSIVGSLLLHGIALYLTGMVQMKQSILEEKILTVHLKQAIPQEAQTPEKQPPPPAKKEPVKAKVAATPKPEPPPAGKREDTVDLGDLSTSRYKPYLVRIKKRIERFWTYPSWAASRKIEGTAMIIFSITSDGILDDISITSSSGSKLLDQGTITAVRSASPFDPLPPTYGLSKLNIRASFAYKTSN